MCGYYKNGLSVREPLSGKTVWETEIRNRIVGSLFFNAPQQLVFIEQTTSAGSAPLELVDEYFLTVLSARDGSQLGSIPISRVVSSATALNTLEFPQRAQGVLVGTDYFVGTLFKKENNVR